MKKLLVIILFNSVYANNLLIPKGTVLDFTNGGESTILVKEVPTGKMKRCTVKLKNERESPAAQNFIFESCVDVGGSQTAAQAVKSSPSSVGGWYPVFFDKYDQAQIDSIINTIKDNRARRIVVLYDKNTKLADKIIAGIQSKVNFAVERSHDVPKDTATTQYDHDRVVVTVFLK